MIFWLSAAALTLLVILVALRPLLARDTDALSEAEHDLQVYRDQLRELDDEVARGVIGEDDARQARTEISRRLLAASDRAEAMSAGSGARSGASAWALAGLAGVFVAGLTVIVYGGLGSPDMPAQPLAVRLEAQREAEQAADSARAQMQTLIDRAEAQLAANPDDGRGWDVLAPVYLRLGDADKAIEAYQNAIRLLGPSSARLSGIGEAAVAKAGGVVNEPALVAFRESLKADPSDSRARFFVALAEVQAGRFDTARSGWEALAADEAAVAEWRAVAARSLEQLASAEAAGATGRPPALSEETVEQAGDMSAEDRQAMIRDMVAGLDERLRANPDDIEAWKRLIRARIVLDDADALRDTLQRAQAAYGDRPEMLAQLKEFAAGFGVNVEEIWQ